MNTGTRRSDPETREPARRSHRGFARGLALALTALWAQACTSTDATSEYAATAEEVQALASLRAPERDGLRLEPTGGASDRIRGAYREGDAVLSFDLTRNARVFKMMLGSPSAGELMRFELRGSRYFFSFKQGAFVSTSSIKDVEDGLQAPENSEQAVAAESGAALVQAQKVFTQGDASVMQAVFASKELALLPKLSKALGDAGLDGLRSQAALGLHRLAQHVSQAGLAADVALPSEDAASWMPQPGSAEVPYCLDLRSDPNHDGCFGMCGKGCSCWSWVCGDCCYHRGCYMHDSFCARCKWYRPVDCANCYMNLAVFIAVVASC